MAKVSTNPETFEGGAGFLDGWTTEIIGAEYVVFDGQGNWENESPCLCLLLDNDQLEKPVPQYWSAGSLTNFVPSDDGTYLEVVGDRMGLWPTCGLAALWKSFKEHGAPQSFMDAVTENCSALIGCIIEWESVKLRKTSKYGTPLVKEIISMPEETVGQDPAEVAGEIVLEVLAAADGKVAMKQFPKAATVALKNKGLSADDTEAVRKFLFSKDFLAAGDGWESDGKTLTSAA